MTYQVLARKWRPRSFADLVGQEHVVRALTHALDNDRLHHAFLFTGTRGVGKTTIARILAKSLNCEKGVSSTPCGECAACAEIDAGRFVDLIEVDAASRTKVDDTRELLDNVQYTPSKGRYKVYLIDEVHMLSTHSFNALLKTLEEPPPHVKFLFATTDPQRMPVTILSRCLQFNLKKLPAQLIGERIEHILAAEGIEAEAAAVNLVARAAEGSVRDALSLLDQAIPYSGGALREAEVREMLGALERRHVLDLLDALARSDGEYLLERVAELDQQAPDYAQVLGELAGVLQRIAVVQAVPRLAALEDNVGLEALAETLAPEDTQLYYDIALRGRRELDMQLAPDPRAGFEMTLLRMLAFRPDGSEAAGAPPRPQAQQEARAAKAAPQDAASSATPAPARKAAPQPQPQARTAPTQISESSAGTAQAASDAAGPRPWRDPDWMGLVDALGLRGAAQQLALNCTFDRREGNTLVLKLAEGDKQLATEGAQTRLEDGLSAFYREPLKIRIESGALRDETPAQREERRQEALEAAARRSMESDPFVQALKSTFDAEVDPDSIRPAGS